MCDGDCASAVSMKWTSPTALWHAGCNNVLTRNKIERSIRKLKEAVDRGYLMPFVGTCTFFE